MSSLAIRLFSLKGAGGGRGQGEENTITQSMSANQPTKNHLPPPSQMNHKQSTTTIKLPKKQRPPPTLSPPHFRPYQLRIPASRPHHQTRPDQNQLISTPPTASASKPIYQTFSLPSR